MNYIKVTKENLETEHICCAISDNNGIQLWYLPLTESKDFDSESSIALGVMFIIMSLLCRYGAELRENKDGKE